MPISVKIKAKIKINGKEYASLEEVPPELRTAYEKAMAEVDKNRNNIMEALEAGMRDGGQVQWSSNPQAVPEPVQPGGSLKKVYRRIWLFLLAGVWAFFAVAALISKLEGEKGGSAAGPYIWLFSVPVVLVFMAIYTSATQWRCPSCGSSLPTRFYKSKGRRCPKCGREYSF